MRSILEREYHDVYPQSESCKSWEILNLVKIFIRESFLCRRAPFPDKVSSVNQRYQYTKEQVWEIAQKCDLDTRPSLATANKLYISKEHLNSNKYAVMM